jgi:hypothetical protein
MIYVDFIAIVILVTEKKIGSISSVPTYVYSSCALVLATSRADRNRDRQILADFTADVMCVETYTIFSITNMHFCNEGHAIAKLRLFKGNMFASQTI